MNPTTTTTTTCEACGTRPWRIHDEGASDMRLCTECAIDLCEWQCSREGCGRMVVGVGFCSPECERRERAAEADEQAAEDADLTWGEY